MTQSLAVHAVIAAQHILLFALPENPAIEIGCPGLGEQDVENQTDDFRRATDAAGTTYPGAVAGSFNDALK